ncbi:MAG: MmcQ/YjbR family DNA-binding protein [Bacteroidota bacterium]
MISISSFLKMALSFDEVTEQPHFEKTSFRVNKKIFITLDETKQIVVVKLTVEEQAVFCLYDKTVMYPVPGKWGLQGWTRIELKKVKKEMLLDALTVSYCNTAPKKLAEKYKRQ